MRNGRPFIKMHGLGNDFVILDGRERPVPLEPLEIEIIASRNTGIGCDQLLVLGPSENADAYMHIFNADGTEADACGNGARCVAKLLMKQMESDKVTLETNAGILSGFDAGEGLVTVDMGSVKTNWEEIPMAEEKDTLHVDIEISQEDSEEDPLIWDPIAVNVGNPHLVFLVKNPNAIDLESIGPVIENSDLFPEGINVGMALINGDDTIRLRVWERGVGITSACGTAACAALVAAVRREHMGRSAVVEMDGGALGVHWREDNGHVMLTGPTTTSFEGEFNIADLLVAAMQPKPEQ
jgi:diaminopimelate epimerase